jgi:hypothetical protein
MGGNIFKHENENIVATPYKLFEKWSENPGLDYNWLVNVISQRVSESLLAAGAMQQNLAQGQHAFTQAAPMAAPPGMEAAGVADEVRKLGQRMDDLESRMTKV